MVFYRLNVQLRIKSFFCECVCGEMFLIASTVVADWVVSVPAESAISTGVSSVIDVVITAIAAAGTGLRSCSLEFIAICFNISQKKNQSDFHNLTHLNK